jgi:hypothetical protein
MTNCPNCGAVITGPVCEYCRTIFKRQSDIDALISENERLKNLTAVEQLYTEAVMAMRAYRNGLLTANEVRRLVL